MLRVMVCALVACLSIAGAAAAASLFPQDTGAANAPLIVAAPDRGPMVRRASLFSGAAPIGLFAPLPQRTHEGQAPVRFMGPRVSPAHRVLDLIARAEAGSKGYDAVQYGARIKPPRRPTTLTIQDIYTWIAQTPGQPHAIGRYQFIPKTLKRLVKRLGASPRSRFSPELQDQLAMLLLEDAGYSKMRAGKITRRTFMNNLAKIWAGLPNSSGKSHYHGYAGNKATMTWARFDYEMSRIFSGA